MVLGDTEGTLIGWAAVITAAGGAVASVVAAVRSGRGAKTAERIHAEIQTGNGRSIGRAVNDAAADAKEAKENGK